MRPYTTDIKDETKANEAFRRVLFTDERMQLVVMCLKPGEDIGAEVHENQDQFFRIEKGKARFELEIGPLIVEDDSVIIVPAGVRHNVVNDSWNEDLKLYTIYAPPAHPPGTIHQTKAEADRAEHAHA